jgi:predicted dehydrogenase
LKIGLVGCGRIAQVAHLPALARVPDLKLTGVMDVSEELSGGVGQRYGCKAYTDLGQMLSEIDPDAVIVAVPDRMHRDVSLQCLKAGADVLVEKPVASSAQAAADLVSAVARTGRFLQVGTMKRHDPGVIYARQVIEQELGRVLSFTAWYRAPSLRDNFAGLFPPVVTDSRVSATEKSFKADTGMYWLNTHGSHLWDTIRYLLMDEVTSLTALRADQPPDISWQVAMRLASGGVGTADLTVNAHGEGSEGINVRCERGTLELTTYIPFTNRVSEVTVFRDATGHIGRPALGYANPYERQLRSFMAATAAHRSGSDSTRASSDLGLGIPATAQDGLAVMRILEAVTRGALNDDPQVIA